MKQKIILLRRIISENKEEFPLISFSKKLQEIQPDMQEKQKPVIITHEDFFLNGEDVFSHDDFNQTVLNWRNTFQKNYTFIINSVFESTINKLMEPNYIWLFPEEKEIPANKISLKDFNDNINVSNHPWLGRVAKKIYSDTISLAEKPFDDDISYAKTSSTYIDIIRNKEKTNFYLPTTYCYQAERHTKSEPSGFCSFKFLQSTTASAPDFSDPDIHLSSFNNKNGKIYFNGYPTPLFDFGQYSFYLRVCADHTLYPLNFFDKNNEGLGNKKFPIIVTSNAMYIGDSFNNILTEQISSDAPLTYDQLNAMAPGLYEKNQQTGQPKLIENPQTFTINTSVVLSTVSSSQKSKIYRPDSYLPGFINMYGNAPYIVYSNPTGTDTLFESNIYQVTSKTLVDGEYNYIFNKINPTSNWTKIDPNLSYEYAVYMLDNV